MVFDEKLAKRVREALPADVLGRVTERKMFGGLAFLLDGHMFVGIVGAELMVRLGAEGTKAALRTEHVREMDFTGLPSKGMVFVQPAGLRGPALRPWVDAGAAYARTLPPKNGAKNAGR